MNENRAFFFFSLRIKSTQAVKSTITVTMSCAVEVYDISDPENPVLDRTETVGSGEASFPAWFVGIDAIKAKLSNAPDSAYITAPSEVVLLVGSTCTFKAIRTPSNAPDWPDGKPVWKLGATTSSGEIFEENVNDSGSATLTCECGNIKTITVTKVQPEVISVDFRGDGVQTIYDVGTTPEWKKADTNGQGARNEPFSAVKNKNINYYAKFSANKDLTFSTKVWVSVNKGAVVYQDSYQWQHWETEEVTKKYLTPNKISQETLSFEWHYRTPDSDFISCGSTEHKGYITWDTKKCPDADFTKKHIFYACSTANGATTIAKIGELIGPDAVSNTRFGNDTQHDLSNVWILIDENKKGDCGTLSTLMKAAIQLLGDSSAEVKFVFSRHTSWNNFVKDSGSHTNNEQRSGVGTELGFMNPDYNYHEGCCKFQGKWWMGGLGTSKDSAYDVLMHVSAPNNSSTGKRQVWYDLQNTPVSYPP